MIRAALLTLLLPVLASAQTGDYFHRPTCRVAFARSASKYTTTTATADGWQVLDVASMPPEAMDAAQRTRILTDADWIVDPDTGAVTSTDPEGLLATRAARRQSERAGLLQEIARLKIVRQQLRALPPGWASEAVIAEAEAAIDSESAAISARGQR